MNTKKAIIVGASSGIGREVAIRLIEDGWTVGIAARRQEALYDIKACYPKQVEVANIDITKEEAGTQLLRLIDTLGGIDLYFHASGIGKQNLSLQEDIEMNTVMTNGIGFTRMVGTAFRYMAEHGGGTIAVISSIAGTKGLGAAPSYSATKAFQNKYIEALEQQVHLRKLNIHFTDIRPGFVATALLNGGEGYPLLLRPENVAKEIVDSIYKKRHVRVVDWKYRILTPLWRMLPRWLWVRLPIANDKTRNS